MENIRKVFFVGPSASQSQVHLHFDKWTKLFGIKAKIKSFNLPVGSGPAEYKSFVDRVIGDELIAGAVITNHKVNLFDSCGMYFSRLEAACGALKSISVVRRRGRTLEGDAEEVRALTRVLNAMLDHNFTNFGDVVIFGGGGAGRALAYALLMLRSRYPFERIFISDSEQKRFRELPELMETWVFKEKPIVVILGTPSANDELIDMARPGSLIVNATGLGKDFPGSPISKAKMFPRSSVVWDFNYRGSLEFLRHAEEQMFSQSLIVRDGKQLFVSEWFEALTYIFADQIDDHLYANFELLANAS